VLDEDLVVPADYRITYEEQCSMVRDHHHFSISVLNRQLEEGIAREPPITDTCPVCGGAVIWMSNQMEVE